ncbi:TERF1-interacting nuclear factor 2 [Parambassis ranga]|uniref:TERF1-interacting nuclear factor 2 n=1 Tax=Parambassis ranga TaxID=210632 RepID=A0A6P7K5R1_9TELE|nr:TERF1-interacting nuclear factor 2 [Parambassis ranga]XP_028284620.1 TERF1-interacting nuclear factor 2 [Parambassis ranga]
MAERKPKEKDVSLPFAALQLLAPPVRLVSAALWKVLKQKDVMQYGILEEFVTSACETVPGLLTLRHQSKLALGLRGRLIMELCSRAPDVKVIQAHLERICVPAVPASSTATMKKDVKIKKSVENFHFLIHSLLEHPSERELFFKEQFPVEFGSKFDQELEKLMWEFLIRLDQLLPVPSLAQTVSWLSDAPPVLEECAQAATQPQLLNILLEHQACLGHLESAASLPPNMGDPILASLSLPPSGRVASNQTRDQTFITPVIGLISNEDVPVMISASQRTLQGDKAGGSKDAAREEKDNFKLTLNTQRRTSKVGQGQVEEDRRALIQCDGGKRKKPDERESDSDEAKEEELLGVKRSGKKRHFRGYQRKNGTEADGAQTVRKEGCDREGLAAHMTKLGVKNLPEDPFLRSIFASCVSSQPEVIIEKLSETSLGTKRADTGGENSDYVERQRRKSPSRKATFKQTSNRQTRDFPGLGDKENHPLLTSVSSSPSHPRSNTGDGDDYVADSEDEATKNFKGRLFMKRYYKTKHGTYVPTLREFWRPGMSRSNLLSAGKKSR